MKTNPTTVIVGAGWAGLTCAIKMIRAGVDAKNITIIEAAPQPGGRAKSINFNEHVVDNGQHLFIGAYKATLEILQTLHIREEAAFIRMPMQLLLKTYKHNIALTTPNLSTPWHFIAAILLAKGLTIKEQIAALNLSTKLSKTNFQLAHDASLLTALGKFRQPDSLIKKILQPIALATMSTPIQMASANVFFRVLKDTFTQVPSNSNWLFPKKDLSLMFPLPAINYLTKQGVKIIFGHRIKEVLFHDTKCIGVKSKQHSWNGQQIVLATPPWATVPLLTHPALQALAQNLSQITCQPITTIYFSFAKPITLPYPMIGLLNGVGQWVFDRAITGQTNVLSVVITGVVKNSSNTALTSTVYRQLQKVFPHLPTLIASKVVQEKRAAFSCTPEMQLLRPNNTTAISNLFLVGDYTQTDYPATIESAVRSGSKCAEILSN